MFDKNPSNISVKEVILEIAVHQLVSLLKMDSFTVFFEDFAY